MPFEPFTPPRRTLMGPGPTDIPKRVLDAMARPVVGHLDPSFVELMEEIKVLLRYAFQTQNEVTFPVSGPGTAGMELCIANLVEPGDTVIVCQNGYFGMRLRAMAERCGAVVVVVEDEWGRAVSPDKLQTALRRYPEARLVACVHAETSTGVLSDVETLAAIAREHECLTLVDTVASLGGVPFYADRWGIDVVYTGSQKCLSCTPGLAPVTFSERAVETIRRRETPVQGWFMDLELLWSYWGDAQRRYHHTAPINALYALHEALLVLQEEGLERTWKRHVRLHEALRIGLEALGLRLVVPEDERAPQINLVAVPEGVDEGHIRMRLLEDFGVEIGAGLGIFAGKVWRIGLMGYSCRAENVLHCLEALEKVLAGVGVPVQRGQAVAAAQLELGEEATA